MTMHRVVDGQAVPLAEPEVAEVVQEWAVNARKLGSVLDASEAVLLPALEAPLEDMKVV